MATLSSPPSRLSSAFPPVALTSSRHSSTSNAIKSPGSSPRTPLLLHASIATKPSTLTLISDDPTLDFDFDLLFIHDDNSSSTRPKPKRLSSSFKEELSNPRPSRSPQPQQLRRDWSTFNFSHYGSQAGAAGSRGKGRPGAMYVKNREQLVREDDILRR